MVSLDRASFRTPWRYRPDRRDDGKEHWKGIGSYPVYGSADAWAKMLEMHVFPLIGKKNIYDVATKDMFAVVERLTNRDARDTARRIVQFCSRIFEFAMLKEYCETDPCCALRSQIAKDVARKKKHLPAIIEPDKVADLLRSIDAYPQTIVRLAMQFSAYTFCRPGEIRHAEWSEIDFDKKVWELPASKMKMKREHMVPLAHAPLDQVRDAYNRAKYWNERVDMMSWYADYLDSLKNGEEAPPKKSS